jgi:hypothetical protein
VIELEDGQQQVERKGGVGFELFVKGEENFFVGDAGDFGAVEEASSDYIEDLAGLGAEDAGEMGSLVSGEGGSGLGPGVGDPASSGHGLIITDGRRDY